MARILKALKQGLESCLDMRILLLLFVPFFLAVVIAAILFFSFGVLWVNSLSIGLEQTAWVQFMVEKWQIGQTVSSISYLVTLLLVILLILPLAYLLAVVLVSLALMPVILRILEKNQYPNLEKKYGGTLAGNIWNTLKTSLLYLFLLVVSLPLWLFPGFAIVVPVALGAYLNKKLFVYDVLEEYASKEERGQIETQHQNTLYGLGAILGFLNYLPLTFVVMPVYAGLVYSHFCLNALNELRENKST